MVTQLQSKNCNKRERETVGRLDMKWEKKKKKKILGI